MSTEEETAPPPSRPKHPMPGMCWAWAVGALFLLLIGVLWLWVYFHRFDPPLPLAEGAKKPAVDPLPPDDPRWNAFLVVACVGIFNGIASWVVWYRFAIQRTFTRAIWQIGIGIILTGAAFFFLTGWLMATMIALVVLALWVQRLTKQHFDLT